MPKAAKTDKITKVDKVTKVETNVASTTQEKVAMEMIYPELRIIHRSTTSEEGPVTPKDMETLLGWETERAYKKRMTEEQGGKPEDWNYGDDYHCNDTQGQKVRCWNNANNRPFDKEWCADLIHTILHGQWAGPLTVPGETINGETIRIGRYGNVFSGQHQGTALKLADEYLQASRQEEGNAANPKYPFWNGHDHPVIETIIIFGVSENPRILQTIDYVKPRSVADMLYTMELFRTKAGVKAEPVSPSERKELTRMLASAVDTLWDRTDTRGYKTHPEIVGFLERHKTLLDCVQCLFDENCARADGGGRKISKLSLSPGACAALMYLMATSGPKTDGDKYRNMSPPDEKKLDWTMWDKAEEFWVRLASGRSFMPVRTALATLLESTTSDEANLGLGGRIPEKFAVIAKAWEVWRDHPGSQGDDGEAGPPFKDDDFGPGGPLCLAYSNLDDKGNPLPDGRIKLLDIADFGGIDCVEAGSLASAGGRVRVNTSSEPMPAAPTLERIEVATTQLQKEAAERRSRSKTPDSDTKSTSTGSLHEEVQRELRVREQRRKTKE